MIKNKRFLLTVVLPILVSIAIGIIIIVLNSTSLLNTRASTTVMSEMNKMNTELAALQSEKKELDKKAAEYDKQLAENKLLVEEIEALNTELNNYNIDIESANSKIAELDKSIADKTEYNNNLSSLTQETDSTQRQYKDVKLNAPTDIAAGRYKAEGDGTLLIYSIAGTLEDKQNLALLDTHSYVFNLTSGQSIKIEGTLTLTAITE